MSNGGPNAMTLNQQEHIFKQAKKWILEAGQLIRTKMTEPIEVDTKSNPNDLVTSVDKETELFFVNKIQKHYPNHFLLGEEGHSNDITSLHGTVWIIDPIDGTTNFVHQKRNFAISIGIYHNGIGEIGFVYDVMSDTLYHAIKDAGAFKNNEKLLPLDDGVNLTTSVISLSHLWLCENLLVDESKMQQLVKTVRGVRSSGSAALDIASVAEGALNAYLALELSPWDIAGGMVLLKEVGGVMTTHLGESVDMLNQNSIITCNASIHPELIHKFLEKGAKK